MLDQDNYNFEIDYTDQLELIETQLVNLNENINNSYVSIINNSINIFEISLIFLGLFIGLFLSFVFGMVAFND